LALHLRPLALALFVAHGFFDYLDGALRRTVPSLATDSPTRAERSHAVADKLSEGAIFLGIALGQYAAWWLAAAAMVASVAATCVGFVVLRATGIPRSRAFFDRTDRVLMLLAFLLFPQTPSFLCLAVVMDCTTVIQRLRTALARKIIVSHARAKGS
jgi:phosphatidylglycerophosphate synthase